MVEKTIELTEEQLEKVKILEENDITMGDAVDLLFKFKKDILEHSNELIDQRLSEVSTKKSELEKRIVELDKEMEEFHKLKNSPIDVYEKQKMLQNQYSDKKSYEIKVQDVKRQISWANDFFKF